MGELVLSSSIVVAFSAVVLVSIAIAWRSGGKLRPTIHAFFWGDQKLNLSLAASLILTSSFSLNGLLYQTWLGYTIGWWSFFIQAVWCAGFLFLLVNARRFSGLLSRGTLHGIIGSRFGPLAARSAAVASATGFAILIGWEAVVGATLLRNVADADNTTYLVLPLALVFVASLYTTRGGLRGNAVVNVVQNALKAVILILAAAVLIGLAPDGTRSLLSAPSAQVLSPATAALALGGWFALSSNLVFSLFWQVADMSLWQNLSATDPRRRARTIGSAAAAVLIFPGLIGAVLGIGLSGIAPSGVTDTNILNAVVGQLEFAPWLSIALFAAFAAAMMSTIDGYALAAAQAVTWDLAQKRQIEDLLPLGPDREPTPADAQVIATSRLFIMLLALTGAAVVMALVFGAGISLFQIVYFVVVAQMSLVGPILHCLRAPDGPVIARGELPIIISMAAGFGCIGLGLLGQAEVYVAAPLVTVAVSVGLAWGLRLLSGPPKGASA